MYRIGIGSYIKSWKILPVGSADSEDSHKDSGRARDMVIADRRIASLRNVSDSKCKNHLVDRRKSFVRGFDSYSVHARVVRVV